MRMRMRMVGTRPGMRPVAAWLPVALGVGGVLGCSNAPDRPARPAPDATDATKLVDMSDPHAAAAAKAVNYLLANQNADGGYGKNPEYPVSLVGVTGLTCYSLMTSPARLTESSSPGLAKAIRYLASKAQPSGAVAEPGQGLENYHTSAAVMALKRTGNPAYKEIIEKARAYLMDLQLDEGEGFAKKDLFWGGAVYQRGGKASDGSNTGMWMDAMHELGVSADDPAMQKALVFMKRLQNHPEENPDVEFTKEVHPDDFGGGVYRPTEAPHKDMPDISKAPRRGLAGWRSYGSMTYQMFKGFIYGGLERDSAAVKGALDWIGNNYTVDENPGVGAQGQFYYYRVFSRTLRAWGEKKVAGRDWAKDIADKLVTLQNEDGSWINPKARWMENDPVLVTAYALEALSAAMGSLGKGE